MMAIFQDFCFLTLGVLLGGSFFLLKILSYPLKLYRLTIQKLATIFRSELDEILSPERNMFSSDIFASTPPRCAIVAMGVIDGHVDISECIRRFEVMIRKRNPETGSLIYPEFSQYIEKWCGYHFWKNDPDFDIRNHVFKYEDDGNKNDSTTSVNIRDIMEHLVNKKFNTLRSPWEVYVVNNYSDPGDFMETGDVNSTVMLFRVHHTLADGYSILYSLIEGVLGTPLSSLNLPTANYVKEERDWKEIVNFSLSFPFRAVRDITNCYIRGVPTHPWKVLDSEKVWRQNFGRSKPVLLKNVKEIKTKLGVSFASVILAAVGSSLWRIMERKGKIVKSGGNQPNLLLLPIPLPGHPNALKIHTTAVVVDLPKRGDSDAVEMVRECEERIQQQRHSTVPYIATFILQTFGLLPSVLAAFILKNKIIPGGLTSFPAGASDISIGIGDYKVSSIEFAVGSLTGDGGFGFSAMSYGKYIRFGVTADGAIMSRSEVDELMKLLANEIDLLHETVQQLYNEYKVA